MNSAEIRQNFLDFFKSKAHHIVPSAPIVIKNDPTLLFTNAGMNQFKEYFLGNKPAPYSRIADTQKCLRVSGKHNDLEEVGVDTYHHTMFEMLGNWSFGNATGEPKPYFKEAAIAWAWELLTEVYKIPERDLYVTVFEGEGKEGLPCDEESLNFWKKWIAEERIIFGNKKDNFWEMGDTGPCGPSTEIHVDCRTDEEKKSIPGKELINKDNPQVIEIWNVVFIQYNRKKNSSLELLPAKHVDTGMGFERLVRVLQNKKSNYDTDIFTGTIAEIEKISGKKYDNSDSKEAISFRVIADHIRAIAFPIADGQLPSNTGAGYVIRRILRRAVRYYFSYLDVKEPMLYKLVPLIANQFKIVFPELDKQKDFVEKVLYEEEQNFLRTLEVGLRHLDAVIDFSEDEVISGRLAFIFYDTYGFPLDLTKLVVAEHGLSVDEIGFEKEMQQQKDRSRAASKIDVGDWEITELVASENNSNVSEVELEADTSNAIDNEDWRIHTDIISEYVGDKLDQTRSMIARYRTAKIKGKTLYQFVLWQTPFYAESGGQVGDTGTFEFEGGDTVKVLDTKKENDLIIHYLEKFPIVGSNYVIAKVDKSRKKNISVHHSATHLMHAALRKVLGTHVQQKGSLVNEDYLRFDFSHFSKMTKEEIEKVESIVNKKIRQNIPVVISQMPKEEAIKTGAMALFGEKYGDMVRVVTMDDNYSIELCGGTHVGNTGELGIFKITTETAVGAGLRRIEAVSGKAAEDFINKELEELIALKEQLKNPKDSRKALENLLTEKEKLSKQVNHLELQILATVNEQLKKNSVLINGIRFIGAIVQVFNADALKKLVSLLKENLENYLIVLCADIEGKANVVVAADEKFISSKKIDAVKIIKERVALMIKGGGGGHKTLASAGGQDVSKLNEVIENVRSLL